MSIFPYSIILLLKRTVLIFSNRGDAHTAKELCLKDRSHLWKKFNPDVLFGILWPPKQYLTLFNHLGTPFNFLILCDLNNIKHHFFSCSRKGHYLCLRYQMKNNGSNTVDCVFALCQWLVVTLLPGVSLDCEFFFDKRTVTISILILYILGFPLWHMWLWDIHRDKWTW